jgi:hypothetical protein
MYDLTCTCRIELASIVLLVTPRLKAKARKKDNDKKEKRTGKKKEKKKQSGRQG